MDTGRDEERTHPQFPSGVRNPSRGREWKVFQAEVLALGSLSQRDIPLEALHYQWEDAQAPRFLTTRTTFLTQTLQRGNIDFGSWFPRCLSPSWWESMVTFMMTGVW